MTTRERKRSMSKLSIVVPVYYNEETLDDLYQDLKKTVFENLSKEDSYELIFVDDGSGDGSRDELSNISRIDRCVKVIALSRNFGSHAASLCGILNATGDCIVTKSADLQEPSNLILELFRAWKDGFEVCLAVRAERDDPSLFSTLYYWLTQKTALPGMPIGGFDNFLIDRSVAEEIRKIKDPNIVLTGQILWSGFKTTQILYHRLERPAGNSRWTLKKKIRLVADTLFGFSTAPVSMLGFLGMLLSAIGMVLLIIGACASASSGIVFWDELQISTMILVAGILLIGMWVLGEYLWRILDASRNKPAYIIDRVELNTEAELSSTRNSKCCSSLESDNAGRRS